MMKPVHILTRFAVLALVASLPLVLGPAHARAQDATDTPPAGTAEAAPAEDGATATATSPDGAAADVKVPEWPCISRKVIEIVPAQIWDGPSLEGLPNWRNDDAIRKLSEFIIARRIPEAEVEAAIKKYAKSVPKAERDAKLATLFSGALSRINDERKIVMAGIERFHKRQMARAKEIEKEGLSLPNQSAALPDAPIDAAEIDHLTPEEEKYRWEVRVFQERQQNIPIACEIPQLIEERAGIVARSIRAQMEN